jgi:hypothetical protein
MENSNFDKHLDHLIAKQKAIEPNPFASTRIMQRIDSEFLQPNHPSLPGWTRVLQPVAIAVALVIGIVIGTYTARSGQETATQAINKTEQRESLRADLFITDLTTEDNILNLNK